MLNPKFERYAERLHMLVEDGKAIVRLAKSTNGMTIVLGEDLITLSAWLTKAMNSLEIVFGLQSPQVRSFREVLPKEGLKHLSHTYEIHRIIGVIAGAVDDLENGYLGKQEYIIAGEVFDSVIEQAKNLNKIGYKDPAAVLARVVIEDALRRLARSEGIDDTQKTSQINDDLKKKDFFTQVQWRFVQAWLDIGNNAAHGKFDQYEAQDVTKMIEGIEQFILFHLHS